MGMCPACSFEDPCDTKHSCKECEMYKEGDCKGCQYNRFDEKEVEFNA
jgi:hypothetical protein